MPCQKTNILSDGAQHNLLGGKTASGLKFIHPLAGDALVGWTFYFALPYDKPERSTMASERGTGSSIPMPCFAHALPMKDSRSGRRGSDERKAIEAHGVRALAPRLHRLDLIDYTRPEFVGLPAIACKRTDQLPNILPRKFCLRRRGWRGGSKETRMVSGPITSIQFQGMTQSSSRPSRPNSFGRPNITIDTSCPEQVSISTSQTHPSRAPSLMQITSLFRISTILQHIRKTPPYQMYAGASAF